MWSGGKIERLCRIATIAAVLSVPLASYAHVDDEMLPPNADEIFIPQNLPLMQVVRFTRGDYRLLETRLVQGDTHHLGTMSLPLSTAAVIAGTHDPRSTARVLWEMSRQITSAERAAYLSEVESTFKAALAELGPPPPAVDPDSEAAEAESPDAEDLARDDEDRQALQALLDLIALWQLNPMDGAGS